MVEVGEHRFQRLSEVAVRTLDWAWTGLIPFGKVSLLAGEPGVGKSLVALQLAAMVTRGWQSPMSSAELTAAGDATSRPRSVVMFSAEDAAEDTLLPRLIAAGGDVTRVHVLQANGHDGTHGQRHPGDRCRTDPCEESKSKGPGQSEFDVELSDSSVMPARNATASEDQSGRFRLTRDLPNLELALEQLTRSGEEVGLIVIDPIDRFLGPEDKKRDRIELVSRLIDFAARWGVAVLVVANSSQKAGVRGGSVVYHELVNSARSVLMVAPDLEDKDQRLLLPVKLNLLGRQPGRAFTIAEGALRWKAESVTISSDDYQQQVAVKLKNPLVREEVYEIQRVTRWLKDLLTPGRASSIWIRSNAAYYDISYSTLRRAFKILGCRAIKSQSQWFWSLPGHEGSASPELLEEPLESPEGDLTGVFRESMPNWLRAENLAQEVTAGEIPATASFRAAFGEGAQQDAQSESIHDDTIPAWDRY